jgi:ribosome-associated toxin RatA of RatAB toxin-antitoxin module
MVGNNSSTGLSQPKENFIVPLINVVELLKAPIGTVWELICDVEAYPRIMEPVRLVTVLSNEDNWTIAEWEVELKGSILRWTEKEIRDHANYSIVYHQIDGDLDKLEGYWKLQKLDDFTTEAVLVIDFEIGIPMLKDMLNPIAERALRDNARIMLRSLEQTEAS